MPTANTGGFEYRLEMWFFARKHVKASTPWAIDELFVFSLSCKLSR